MRCRASARRAVRATRGRSKGGRRERTVFGLIIDAVRGESEARSSPGAAEVRAGADPREGMLAYLDLDEPLRAEVRARAPREELDTLDLTASGRAGDREKVEAALALPKAHALLAGDPGAALTLLGPHAAVLERVPEARRITREAEARLRSERASRARAEVQAARAELAAGAAAEALARLEAAPLRDLPEEERAAAAACQAEAARILERRRRTEEAGKLRGAGRLFEARALCDGLAASAGDDLDRRRWEAERDAIRAEIRRAFRVEVDDTPQPATALSRFRPDPELTGVPWWLTADGREIVVARAHERWVVVRVLDLASREIRRTVLLRTPEPLGEVAATVCGATLWLAGARGAVVEIAMESWEILDFRPSADLAGPAFEVDGAKIAPGGAPSSPSCLWVSTLPREGGHRGPFRVFDLAQRRLVREIHDGFRMETVAGLPEPRMALFRLDGCTLYTPRGATAMHGRIDSTIEIQGIAAHPEGDGFVASLDSNDELQVGAISATGEILRTLGLPAGSGMAPCVASLRGSGVVFVVERDDEPRLFACRASAGGDLAPLWDEVCSTQTMLVQDAGAGTVVALAVHDAGVDATILGPEPPGLSPRPRSRRLRVPGRRDVILCNRRVDERESRAYALSARLDRKSGQEVATWVKEREADAAATPEDLVDVVFMLRVRSSRAKLQVAEQMVARLVARFPAHPEVRMLAANDHATPGAGQRRAKRSRASIPRASRRAG